MAKRQRTPIMTGGGKAMTAWEQEQDKQNGAATATVPDPTERPDASEGPPVDTDPVHPVDSPPAPTFAAPDRMAAARAARANRGPVDEEYRVRYFVCVRAHDTGAWVVLQECRSQRGAEKWCEPNAPFLRIIGTDLTVFRTRKVDSVLS